MDVYVAQKSAYGAFLDNRALRLGRDIARLVVAVEGTSPMTRPALAVVLLCFGTLLSGCVAPLVAGAGAAIAVDEINERDQGGDGLF